MTGSAGDLTSARLHDWTRDATAAPPDAVSFARGSLGSRGSFAKRMASRFLFFSFFFSSSPSSSLSYCSCSGTEEDPWARWPRPVATCSAPCRSMAGHLSGSGRGPQLPAPNRAGVLVWQIHSSLIDRSVDRSTELLHPLPFRCPGRRLHRSH
jgi:hypothetical protein